MLLLVPKIMEITKFADIQEHSGKNPERYYIPELFRKFRIFRSIAYIKSIRKVRGINKQNFKRIGCVFPRNIGVG